MTKSETGWEGLPLRQMCRWQREGSEYPTLFTTRCLEGLFTATHTVLESSTSLCKQVLTASSLLFCMCSVIVNKDAIMLSRPPCPPPGQPHEE